MVFGDSCHAYDDQSAFTQSSTHFSNTSIYEQLLSSYDDHDCGFIADRLILLPNMASEGTQRMSGVDGMIISPGSYTHIVIVKTSDDSNNVNLVCDCSFPDLMRYKQYIKYSLCVLFTLSCTTSELYRLYR